MIALHRDEVNIKSFQTQQKYIDKVFKREYDVFKRNGSEVRRNDGDNYVYRNADFSCGMLLLFNKKETPRMEVPFRI